MLHPNGCNYWIQQCISMHIVEICAVFSTSEALNRYIEGFKSEPRAWVQMQGVSTLDLAM